VAEEKAFNRALGGEANERDFVVLHGDDEIGPTHRSPIA